jgi:hypothetical protein
MAGGLSSTRNIGEMIATVTSVAPQSFSGSSAVNGTGIDRYAHNDPQSCVLHLSTGALSGAPSSFSLTAQLQHAPDDATWTNFGGTVAVTAAATDASLNLDLSGAAEYVRVVVTPAFVGGASPAVLAQADLIFGGEQELPAV